MKALKTLLYNLQIKRTIKPSRLDREKIFKSISECYRRIKLISKRKKCQRK